MHLIEYGRPGHTNDGLAFTELAVGEVKLSPYKWVNGSRLSDGYLDRFKLQTRPGSDSLINTALRSVLRHRRFLSGDELKHLPWEPFGQRLWEHMVSKKAVSVHVWKAFAAGYGSNPTARSIIGDFEASKSISVEMFASTLPLIDCQTQPFEFLTVLEFKKTSMSLEDWLAFCPFKNLLILHLFASESGGANLNPRAARALREHSEQSGALPVLRELIITCRGQDVDLESMDNLAALPRLDSIHFRGGYERLTSNEQSVNWSYYGGDAGKAYPMASESYLFGRNGHGNIARLLALGETIASSHPDDPALSVPRLGVVVGRYAIPDNQMHRIPVGLLLKRKKTTKRRMEDSRQAQEPQGAEERSVKLRKRKQQTFGDLFSGMQGGF